MQISNWFQNSIKILVCIAFVLLGVVDLAAQSDWRALRESIEGSSYRAISNSDVQQSYLRVQEQFSELNREIAVLGVQATSWREFVDRSKLEITSQDEGEIQRVIEILKQNVGGVEWQPLQKYRRGLEECLRCIRAGKSKTLEGDFLLYQKAFATAVDEYEKTKSPVSLARIAQMYDWSVNHSQMADSLRAIQSNARGSNVDVSVSKRLLSEYVRNSFQRPREVSDCILGTSIKGCGIATGFSDVELGEVDGSIRLNIVIRTDVKTKTVGVNGPVKIYSDGSTDIVTYKPIVFDGNSFRALPSYSKAKTESTTTGIRTKFSGIVDRIVKRVATKQIGKQQGQGNLVAAQHAERDTNIATDAEVEPMLVDGNRDFYNQLIRPGLIGGFLGSQHSLSTQSSAIRFASLIAGANQLGAVGASALKVNSGDVRASIHQTCVNNLLSVYLAGKRFSSSDMGGVRNGGAALPQGLRNGVPGASGATQIPGGQKLDSARQVAVTLDAVAPVEVVFEAGSIFVKIRAKTIEVDDRIFSAMTIGLRFQIVREDGSWLLRFDGKPIIYPARLELIPNGRLSGPEVAVRRILRNLIVRDLPKSNPISNLPLSRDHQIIGALVPNQLESGDGWFVYSADYVSQ